MLPATPILAGLAAALHVVFFYFESFLFNRADVQKRFFVAPAHAEAVRPWAFNQGFYNLFLAAGCVFGIIADRGGARGFDGSAGRAVVLVCCASMTGAGIVLALTDRRMLRAAAIQIIPPLLVLYFELR